VQLRVLEVPAVGRGAAAADGIEGALDPEAACATWNCAVLIAVTTPAAWAPLAGSV
jgi:hypothetical protein